MSDPTTSAPAAGSHPIPHDHPPKKSGWPGLMIIGLLILAGLYAGYRFGGPFIWGLYEDFFGDDSVVAATECAAPAGMSRATFDPDGWLKWTDDLNGGDGSATLILCDGSIPRPIRVVGLQPGQEGNGQAGLAVAADWTEVNEILLVTTSTRLVPVQGVEGLKVQCPWPGPEPDSAPIN